jgi:hypothetical protein
MRNITTAAAQAITRTNRLLAASTAAARKTAKADVVEALHNLSRQIRTEPMTEVDLELLRLAGLANGIQVIFKGDTVWRRCAASGSTEWNPLTDDGDCMRLAVNLGIRIPQVHWNIDSITRRAVVEAAAAIGRQMQVAA